jgi:hypothetical protein
MTCNRSSTSATSSSASSLLSSPLSSRSLNSRSDASLWASSSAVSAMRCPTSAEARKYRIARHRSSANRSQTFKRSLPSRFSHFFFNLSILTRMRPSWIMARINCPRSDQSAGGSLQAPLYPPPRQAIPKVIEYTKEVTKEMTKEKKNSPFLSTSARRILCWRFHCGRFLKRCSRV